MQNRVMKGLRLALMWLVVYVLLLLMYAQFVYTFQEAFYFVSMLFPVVLATSYFFNHFLVPRYLLTKAYRPFFWYTLYLFIVSIYLETWVIFLSLIWLADYNYEALSPALDNSINMAILLYAVVFVHGFIRLFIHFQSKTTALQTELEKAAQSKPSAFTVISDRKQVRLEEAEVTYIESLSDYVKIHRKEGKPVISKATITSLEAQLSPDFLRIHRSYLVNKNHVESFSSDKLIIQSAELNITRKYKKAVMEAMKA